MLQRRESRARMQLPREPRARAVFILNELLPRSRQQRREELRQGRRRQPKTAGYWLRELRRVTFRAAARLP